MTILDFLEARLVDQPDDLSEKAANRVREVVERHRSSGRCAHCMDADVNRCLVLNGLAGLWDDHKDYGSWR